MQKYKLGILILAIFSLGFFGYVISNGISSKDDVKTYKAAQTIAEKLNNYTTDKEPPSSLDKLGVKDVPDTIKYSKLSSNEYKFCATYKFDAGTGIDPPSIFSGQALVPNNAGQSGYDYSSSGYLYVTSDYKKGENCQTIKTYSPTLYNSDSNGPSINNLNTQSYNSTACTSAYDAYYGLQGQAKIASVDTTAKTITFQTSGQTVKDSQGNSLSPVSSAKYDSITVFCSAAGQVTSASALNKGDSVKFFASTKTSTILDKVQL
jgi:hypothetical protein